MLSSLPLKEEREEKKTGDATVTAVSGSTRGGLSRRNDVYGEFDPSLSNTLNEDKVQAAMRRLLDEKTSGDDNGMRGVALAVAAAAESSDLNRKRGYNSMGTIDISPEDMEAYRRIKTKRDDPMAQFLGGSDVLLEYNT
jgi:hypothetical protein